ncbi:MAG TPA: hypothetical protein VMR52_05450 [Dehalococcoidia bacterium]|nr:hypothetical protein [Dehalococcoidia bacterium]
MSSQIPEALNTDTDPSGDTHAHHWLIKSQEGHSSEAICKQCGERRDFRNGYKWQPYYYPSRLASSK